MKQSYTWGIISLALVFGLSSAGAVVATGTPAVGQNYVPVASCQNVAGGIYVKSNWGSTYYLMNGYKNAGHGYKTYYFVCSGNSRYRVNWNKQKLLPPPPASPVVQQPTQPTQPTTPTTPTCSLNPISVENGTVVVCGTQSITHTATGIILKRTGLVNNVIVFTLENASQNYLAIQLGQSVSITSKDGTKKLTITFLKTDAQGDVLVFSTETVGYPYSTKPTLKTPTANEVIKQMPRYAFVSWNAVPSASSYEIDVHCKSCESPEWNKKWTYTSSSNLSGTPFVVAGAFPQDGEYRVHVRTKFPNGQFGEWSDWMTFSFNTQGL